MKLLKCLRYHGFVIRAGYENINPFVKFVQIREIFFLHNNNSVIRTI